MNPIHWTSSEAAWTEMGGIELRLFVRRGVKPLVLRTDKETAWQMADAVRALIVKGCRDAR